MSTITLGEGPTTFGGAMRFLPAPALTLFALALFNSHTVDT